MPVDPFDGKPLRYDPVSSVIYSIGGDLNDNGGVADKDGVLRDYDEIVLPLKFADQVDRELRARSFGYRSHLI